MHYILFYEYVDDYVAKRAPFRAAHLDLVRKTDERGEMVIAGAYGEPDKGAALVFRGESPAVAEKFAQADPYVKNGLVSKWHVKKWLTVVGDGAQMPQL